MRKIDFYLLERKEFSKYFGLKFTSYEDIVRLVNCITKHFRLGKVYVMKLSGLQGCETFDFGLFGYWKICVPKEWQNYVSVGDIVHECSHILEYKTFGSTNNRHEPSSRFLDIMNFIFLIIEREKWMIDEKGQEK